MGNDEEVKLDVKTNRSGVGTEEAKVDNTYFKKALHQGLSKIRRTDLTPLRWHKSKGATIRQGLKTRVVHVLPVLGKAFYASLLEKKVKKEGLRGVKPPTPMDHGFFKGRRKEGALMIQLNASWRLKRLGWSHILSNKDMTNAFASSNWQALRAANETLLEEEDQVLGAQRFEETTVELETADGKGLALKT